MKNLLFLALLAAPSAFAGTANVNAVLDFGDQFRAKYGNELKGSTPDGRQCTLSVWDKSYKGDSSCGPVDQREAYISLGTSSDGSASPGSYTYVGFWINPDCTFVPPYDVKTMDVTPQTIHIDILGDGKAPNGQYVENDLVIRTDAQGNLTQVQGSSSHWPSSTCIFK